MKIRVVFVRFLLILFVRLRLWRTEPATTSVGGSWLLGSCVANRREQRRGYYKPGQKPLDFEIHPRKGHWATSVGRTPAGSTALRMRELNSSLTATICSRASWALYSISLLETPIFFSLGARV